MIVAVAIVAVMLYAWREYARTERLRFEYRMRLLDIEAQISSSREMSREVRRMRQPPLTPEKVAFYAALKAKYEHAVRYPWFPVAPDLPEPSWFPASIEAMETRAAGFPSGRRP